MTGSTVGFHFRERMSGWVSTKVRRSPIAGAHQAEADRQWAELILDVDYASLDAVLKDNAAEAELRGTATIAGLSHFAMDIVSGKLRLFVHDDAHVQRWQMEYELELRTRDTPKQSYTLRAWKVLPREGPLDAWPRTTTLYLTVCSGKDTVAAGILHLTMADFLRQFRTMRVTGTADPVARVTGKARYAGMFMSKMVRQFGGLLAEWTAFPPGPIVDPLPRGKPDGPKMFWCYGAQGTVDWSDRLPRPEDKTWLRLARYQGGERGPVILAPGFGMSTDAYIADTIDTNLTQYLMEQGFDVWLFDYRASPLLTSVVDGFTIDDVARVDWPVAIEKVCQETGQETVQVFAHCVGSMSFQMAMLWPDNGAMRARVRQAVCSQVTVHPVSTWFNTLKVRAGLGPVLEKISPILEPDDDLTVGNMLYDLVLRVAPTPHGEACGNAVCQWITAYFGLTHRHAQLNDATHNDLARMFGKAGVHPLRHIGNMVANGQSTDAEGRDVYLNSKHEHDKGNAGNLNIPILFLAGSHNRIFYPDTSKRTLRWLQLSNGPAKYRRVELPDYAHLDAIIGRNAADEVFPIIGTYLVDPNATLPVEGWVPAVPTPDPVS